jgi:hypothetical protein
MSLAPVILHGTVDLDFPDKRITRRDRDLDQIRQTFQRGAAGAIRPGMGFPGASGFRVIEASEDEEVVGECYVYQCRGVGISGGLVAKLIDQSEDNEEEGWDMATQVWLAANKNHIRLGAASSVSPSMVATSVRRRQHPDSPAYWYIEAQFKGILSDKAEKIRITMNGREVSREELVVTLAGGWNTPSKSEVLWPRVSLTRSYLSRNIPSVSVPQQFFGRPSQQAPFVFTPLLSGPVDPVLHWPNGWTLQDVNHEPLAGTSITFCQEVWVYNHKETL